MQSGRRFFATLDGIRGVAAIAVVLTHAESLFGAGTAGENGLAVDVFFILSGVVVTNAYEYRLRYQLSVIEFITLNSSLSTLYIRNSDRVVRQFGYEYRNR
jgi:peptidoglycan/LPS O-acetylase OafA/YrhL